MTFVNDMYAVAVSSDYESYMTGVFLVSLYGLAIVFGLLDFLNKRR